MTAGLAAWFQGASLLLRSTGILIVLMTIVQWWRDVIRESTYQGYHTKKVAKGLKVGMILFIISEVMFFFAFFWAFFHRRLSPSIQVGGLWPPIGINPLNPWGVPLLNTIVLLSSGVSVTWAHHAMKDSNHQETIAGLVITILLGVYFTNLQLGEYMEVRFSISDRVYGSTFFVATGFHGIHVLIGTMFLIVILGRTIYLHFSRDHHVGLEAAIWYWHFVDVVWIFLFIWIYWWGRHHASLPL